LQPASALPQVVAGPGKRHDQADLSRFSLPVTDEIVEDCRAVLSEISHEALPASGHLSGRH